MLARSLRTLLAVLLLATVLFSGVTVRAFGPDASTIAALQSAVVPVRDRIDLARRLLGITALPAPTDRRYAVGDTAPFQVVNLAINKARTATAKLVYQSDHLDFWFEIGYTPNLTAIKRAADNFEQSIYPTVTGLFGREPPPFMDNDPHIYILHMVGLGDGVAGYFDSDSLYPNTVVPESNEHNIFNINLDTMGDQIGKASYEGVLAHEFQHMIRAGRFDREVAWMNEGFSEVAAALTGFRATSGYVDAFAAVPTTQLNHWPGLASSSPNYGASYLFLMYFLGRYGEDTFRDLTRSPIPGLDGVAETIRRYAAAHNTSDRLEDTFADWLVATLINDPRVADGQYAYRGLPTRLPRFRTTASILFNEPQTLKLKQWAMTTLRLPGPGNFKLSFSGAPTVPVIPTQAHSGTYLWWSNRGDQIDTRLTHAFDLRGVSSATLRYWIWYAIEPDWDYGYVMASSDGGRTWTPLRAPHSVPGGGNNNPFGPAYTSTSGGGKPTWVQEQIDLSAYAGKEILLRFELINDDGTNLPGMAVDDISIPEIGYSTDAESDDGGWMTEGWVRMDNILPQLYMIRLVESGNTPRVTELLGPDDGVQKDIEFSVAPDAQRPLLLLSGLTRYTTEPASVNYTFTRVK